MQKKTVYTVCVSILSIVLLVFLSSKYIVSNEIPQDLIRESSKDLNSANKDAPTSIVGNDEIDQNTGGTNYQKSNYTLDEGDILNQRRLVISKTRDYLSRLYNIKVLDEEIKSFIEEEFEGMITEKQFSDEIDLLKKKYKAVEAMVNNDISAKKAAEMYLSEWKDSPEIIGELNYIFKNMTLDELRNMIPSNYMDGIVKSIPGHRDIVVDYKIAQILFKGEIISKKPAQWRSRYDGALIEYAQKNLIDKIDEFKTINFSLLNGSVQ